VYNPSRGMGYLVTKRGDFSAVWTGWNMGFIDPIMDD
jgi:hypothetical protein